jgi:hypothetical protein
MSRTARLALSHIAVAAGLNPQHLLLLRIVSRSVPAIQMCVASLATVLSRWVAVPDAFGALWAHARNTTRRCRAIDLMLLTAVRRH